MDGTEEERWDITTGLLVSQQQRQETDPLVSSRPQAVDEGNVEGNNSNKNKNAEGLGLR